MPQITFIQPDGRRQVLEAADAPTVMHLAIRHDVAGLPAECGGQLACATCMVDVPPGWRDRLPPASPDEQDMIEDTIGSVPEGRRLCCQVAVTPALDGLEVAVPETQG
ncbi:2Fe-2S iron-sulfur cluster binding domain-containing protein [Belnapia sp. T6]|uniref:2Fe-2S iron-sulfur cluster binding domain-containing protein n=1 Tax=Belnapia mucosa TaxID=2804532 RepID=A0ABS1UXV5_9PROT|nr:2Fe-2S iron-sulfur cluster-binding protein [Belnapia mucosa]MBL6454299.1 2Fe-2S iron-sulfur cluster binding domain-containing protein [Belnapia mucosa]